jgi:hypothetical protein
MLDVLDADPINGDMAVILAALNIGDGIGCFMYRMIH